MDRRACRALRLALHFANATIAMGPFNKKLISLVVCGGLGGGLGGGGGGGGSA
jgi:hypothetical protein